MKFFTALLLLFSFQKSTLCHKVTSIPISRPTKVGYSPHWDAENGRLLFADQYGQNATICQYSIQSCETVCATITNEQYASAIIPVDECKNEFVVALRTSIKLIKWNGKTTTASVIKDISSADPKVPYVYMDTAKADATGRLYFGTYGARVCGSTANSKLYSWTPKEGVKTVLTGFKSCFGLAFNSKTDKAYFMDTCSYTIFEYDWCRETGQLSNRRVIHTFDVIPGAPSFVPFGLAIDCENNFYVGSYGGGSLLKISTSNNCTTVENIEMPTKLVGCPTFGGPHLTDIFITSCSSYLDFNSGRTINNHKNCNGDMLVSVDPKGGSLLRIEQTKLKGVAAYNVRLC